MSHVYALFFPAMQSFTHCFQRRRTAGVAQVITAQQERPLAHGGREALKVQIFVSR
jgi:hypothetical protein